MPTTNALLVSCEHAGRRIRARYRVPFGGHEALLQSHRGYAPGAIVQGRGWTRLRRRLIEPLGGALQEAAFFP